MSPVPIVPQDIVQGTGAAFSVPPEWVFADHTRATPPSKRSCLLKHVAYTLLREETGMSVRQAMAFLNMADHPRGPVQPLYLSHLAAARRFARLHAERRARLVEEILAS